MHSEEKGREYQLIDIYVFDIQLINEIPLLTFIPQQYNNTCI